MVLTSNGTMLSWADPATAGTVTSVGTSVTGVSCLSFAASPNPIVGAGSIALGALGSKGDIPYFSATNTISNLAAGPNDNMYYGTLGGIPSVQYGPFLGLEIHPTSAALTADSGTLIGISNLTGTVTLTLPTASTCPGKTIYILNGTDESFIAPAGTDTINGDSTPVSLAPNEVISLINADGLITGDWATFTDQPGYPSNLSPLPNPYGPGYANMIASSIQGTNNIELSYKFGGLVGTEFQSRTTSLTAGSASEQVIASPTVALSLPAASTCPGKIFQIINGPTHGENFLQTSGSDTFLSTSSTNISLADGESVSVVSTSSTVPNTWDITRDCVSPAFQAPAANMIASTLAGLNNSELGFQYGGITGFTDQTGTVALTNSATTMQLLEAGATVTLPQASTCPNKILCFIGSENTGATIVPFSGDSLVNSLTEQLASFTQDSAETIWCISVNSLLPNTWLIFVDNIAPSFLQTPVRIGGPTPVALDNTVPQTIAVSAGPVTLDLPAAGLYPNKMWTITVSGDPATVVPISGDIITNITNGQSYSNVSPLTVVVGEQITIVDVSNISGHTWWVIQDVIPASQNTGDVGVAHLIGETVSPTVTVDTTGAGTNATASVQGNDLSGTITLNTSALDTPVTGNPIVVLAFTRNYNTSEHVTVTPSNSAAWALPYGSVQYIQANTTTSQFELDSVGTPLPPLTVATYTWNYTVSQ